MLFLIMSGFSFEWRQNLNTSDVTGTLEVPCNAGHWLSWRSLASSYEMEFCRATPVWDLQLYSLMDTSTLKLICFLFKKYKNMFQTTLLLENKKILFRSRLRWRSLSILPPPQILHLKNKILKTQNLSTLPAFYTHKARNICEYYFVFW